MEYYNLEAGWAKRIAKETLLTLRKSWLALLVLIFLDMVITLTGALKAHSFSVVTTSLFGILMVGAFFLAENNRSTAEVLSNKSFSTSWQIATKFSYFRIMVWIELILTIAHWIAVIFFPEESKDSHNDGITWLSLTIWVIGSFLSCCIKQ